MYNFRGCAHTRLHVNLVLRHTSLSLENVDCHFIPLENERDRNELVCNTFPLLFFNRDLDT